MRKLLVALALASFGACVAMLAGVTPFAGTVEMKTYDARVRLFARPAAAHRGIVLVNIDEDSIRKLEPLVGRFPWPRLAHAQLVNFLARGPAKVIVYDVLFSERDRTSFSAQGEPWTGEESDDAFVAAVSSAGNVVLAADATREEAEASDRVVRRPASEGVQRQAAGERREAAPGHEPRGGETALAAAYRLNGPIEERPIITPPFEELAHAARAIGHSFLVLDADGPARRSVPFIRVQGRAVPSLAVAGAMIAGRIPPDRVSSDGDVLALGDARMPLVPATSRVLGGRGRPSRRALVRFAGPQAGGDEAAYQEYSFYRLFYSEQQLLAGQAPLVDPAAFRDKVVVVGVTAAGLHDTFAVPFEGQMAGSAIHANVIDNILSRRFMRAAGRPSAWIAVALGALAVAGVCAFFGPWWTMAATLATLGAIGVVAAILFTNGTWLPVVRPGVAVLTTAFAGVAYQYFVEGREKRKLKRVFSRLVAPDVYQHLLADPSRARLGGERREMTVLFSDIRGFTTLSESREPEDVVAQLNDHFTRMVEVLFAHRGTVDKFVGDMVMALFGAPVPDGDHADRAVSAALAMVKALEELNERWAREGRPALGIGVGINTGPMVAGNIGSEQIMSYTVIGDAVNLGSRLESLTRQYGATIVISEDTRSRLKGQYDIRPLGEVTVKGKSRPVSIYGVGDKEN